MSYRDDAKRWLRTIWDRLGKLLYDLLLGLLVRLASKWLFG